MAKLGVINADEIPERSDFSPVPPARYIAMISESEMKPTSKPGGEMLVMTIDIVEGEYAGRKLFERLNLKNDNEKAVEIAYKVLGEIIRATGKRTIEDTEELHNKRILIDVVVDPAKPYMKDGVQQAGSPQNRITKYSPADGSAAAPPANAATAAAATPPQAEAKPAVKTPPWKKKA